MVGIQSPQKKHKQTQTQMDHTNSCWTHQKHVDMEILVVDDYSTSVTETGGKNMFPCSAGHERAGLTTVPV